jgi:hypothetical protein
VAVVESVVLECRLVACGSASYFRLLVVACFVGKIKVVPMKFSIRDLLLVTLIVALAVAWWLDNSRLRDELRDHEFMQMVERSLADLDEALAKSEATFATAQAEHANAIAIAKKVLESQQATDSEGPVRGYTLLGPPLPNSSAPAPNPPNP